MPSPSGVPEPGEYAGYFAKYVQKVGEGDIVEILARQARETEHWLVQLSEEQASFRYAEGKWSVKEVLGHIIDTERVMSYRALRVARGDAADLPGFDQDVFAGNAPHDERPLAELLDEYTLVRGATLALLRPLGEAAWKRAGVVSGHTLSARALAYIIAGHELAHAEILRERYGV